MTAAAEYFRSHGYDVGDDSMTQPYDLLCRKDGRILYVEVKGTTTSGARVVLTSGEVEHARKKDCDCALFVLHSIVVRNGKTLGGTPIVKRPWKPDRTALSAISYIHDVH